MDRCGVGVPSIFVVLTIIICAGLLGGTRNWLNESQSSRDKASLLRCVIDGLIAAAAIPLFLSIIGNEKIAPAFGTIDAWNAHYQQSILILIGFCCLASIFSQRFLESLSKKVMQLNDKVSKVEDEVRKNAEIADLQIEPGSPVLPLAEHPENALGGDQTVILHELLSGRFIMRSEVGLAETTGLAIAVVRDSLTALAAIGLAKRLPTSKGDRWALTDAGRVRLASSE